KRNASMFAVSMSRASFSRTSRPKWLMSAVCCRSHWSQQRWQMDWKIRSPSSLRNGGFASWLPGWPQRTQVISAMSSPSDRRPGRGRPRCLFEVYHRKLHHTLPVSTPEAPIRWHPFMKRSISFLTVVACINWGSPTPAAAQEALVLGGGGSGGLAHGGVVVGMERLGHDPDLVVGTSMGAIVGALYAAGYAPDSIWRLIVEEDWPALFVPDTRVVGPNLEPR